MKSIGVTKTVTEVKVTQDGTSQKQEIVSRHNHSQSI